MNLFRLFGEHGSVYSSRGYLTVLVGDMSHLASILILLYKIQATRSVRGAFHEIFMPFYSPCFIPTV